MRYLGAAMMTAVVVGIFAAVTLAVGLLPAVVIIAASLAITAWILIAISLMSRGN